VMGDDPEYMDTDAVVAARPLSRAQIRLTAPVAGYLYVVCRRPMLAGQTATTRQALFRSSLAGPALGSVLAVVVLGSLLAAWIIVAVTKPLRVLSDEVAGAAKLGFASAAVLPAAPPKRGGDDEFARLRNGFVGLLATLRQQWDELRRLDQFRRESVSNLSHDLRSPLTATVACLDTLERRWASAPSSHEDRAEDRRLLAMALRNTHNAARLVRSLGDLALLDEPEFKLHLMRLDVGEVLDDISLRFAERAAAQGVLLRVDLLPPATGALVATVDVELFERAVANLLDNALKFTPSGGHIVLAAALASSEAGRLQVSVIDSGPGIAPADLAQLFDRYFQSRASVEPASSEDGKGLGLAIVKRIVELHGGSVHVLSTLGQGTRVQMDLPAG
jgi:signal transduction histidine kinase